jgi:hypothetical protein
VEDGSGRFVKTVSAREHSSGELRVFLPMNSLNLPAATGDLDERYVRDNILMIHIGRSGSTVLADLLDKNSQIRWGGEIYHTLRSFYQTLSSTNGEVRFTGDPITYTRNAMKGCRKRYFGFELKFFHLKYLNLTLPEYLTAIGQIGVDRIIVLERRNYLRKIVSSQIANLTNVWHSRHSASQLTRIALNVNELCLDHDRKSLLEFLYGYEESFNALYSFLSNQRLFRRSDILHLTYEDDVAPDPQIGYGHVCEFLRVSCEPVSTQFKKTTPFKLRQILTNYEEVQAALAGTPFSWMLEE